MSEFRNNPRVIESTHPEHWQDYLAVQARARKLEAALRDIFVEASQTDLQRFGLQDAISSIRTTAGKALSHDQSNSSIVDD